MLEGLGQPCWHRWQDAGFREGELVSLESVAYGWVVEGHLADDVLVLLVLLPRDLEKVKDGLELAPSDVALGLHGPVAADMLLALFEP